MATSSYSDSLDVNNIKGVKCLVLGAGGFVGTTLCKTLKSYGAKIYGFGRTPYFLEVFQNIAFTEGDFSDHSLVQNMTQGMDIVFHLISTTLPAYSNANKVFDIESNLVNTIKLLESCQKNNVKKVIFLSSGGTVYGTSQTFPITERSATDPICSYGIVKLTIEKYLALFKHLYGLNYSILRVSNPFGPYQLTNKKHGIIPTILSYAMLNQPITIWGDGNIIRDYIYIFDVIDAIIRAAIYKGDYTIFNVGSGVGRSILEIIQEIEVVLEKKIEVKYDEAKSVDISKNVLASDLAKQELSWLTSTSFQDGLKKTHSWLKSYEGGKFF